VAVVGGERAGFLDPCGVGLRFLLRELLVGAFFVGRYEDGERRLELWLGGGWRCCATRCNGTIAPGAIVVGELRSQAARSELESDCSTWMGVCAPSAPEAAVDC
jgi:hypothetical protein